MTTRRRTEPEEPAYGLDDAMADLYRGEPVSCRSPFAARRVVRKAEALGYDVHDPVPGDREGPGWKEWIVYPKGAQA